MRPTVLPERLQKLTKLITDLTAWRNYSIYLLTCNKCRKQYVGQIVEIFAIGGIITDLTPVNMRMANHTCRNTCTNINSEHRSFLNDVSITLIDKTNPTNPLKKNYWEPTLKTFVPYGLNMKENV